MSSLLQLLLMADWSLPTVGPRLALVLVAAGFIALSLVWYVLWRLPIDAFFRRPIERSAMCPHCGSRDVRDSHINTIGDRFRRKLGLLPFRCRGCTKRFISRSSRRPPVITSEIEVL